MNSKESQQLKHKVKTQQVKNLPQVVKDELSTYSQFSTQIEQAVCYLINQELLGWPLEESDQQIINENISTPNKIPRYIRIIIAQNWNKHEAEYHRLPEAAIVWLHINEYSTVPLCRTCNIKNTHWSTKQKRFTYHCSNTCRAKDPEVNNKRLATCMEKYGNDKLFDNADHLELTRTTCLANHGTLYPMQDVTFQNKSINTKTDRYGEKYKEELNQRSLTQLQIKYEMPNSSFGKILSSPAFQTKKRSTTIQNWLPTRLQSFNDVAVALFDVTDYIDRFQLLPFQCVSCSTIFEDNLRDGTIPRCTACYPLRETTFAQNEITDFIKEYINSPVITNDRSIISPKELDIVIPHHNLAIEYNGLYWHSDIGSRGRVSKEYHLSKTIACRNKDIQLLHIFEDEWLNNKKIIKSILMQLTNNQQNVIYGRKCSIVNVPQDVAAEFLTENHIQGKCNSSVRLGLMYNDELVSVMTFGKSRYDKKCEWEIYRFCNKINHSIIGGANKLFNHFEQTSSPTSVITYSDSRWFTGKIYEKLGFDFIRETKPGYFYVQIDSGCKQRLNRIGFQKHKLQSKLLQFDEQLTESDNMKNNNYGKVWDVGQLVFIKTY